MIVPILPELTNPKDREEVRKAILNLARQIEAELEDIKARLTALEP